MLRLTWAFVVERVTRIELAFSAWEFEWSTQRCIDGDRFGRLIRRVSNTPPSMDGPERPRMCDGCAIGSAKDRPPDDPVAVSNLSRLSGSGVMAGSSDGWDVRGPEAAHVP
jgi:hypothetical protein